MYYIMLYTCSTVTLIFRRVKEIKVTPNQLTSAQDWDREEKKKITEHS